MIRQRQFRTRIGIVCVLVIIGWIVSLIAVFVSLLLVFYHAWPSFQAKVACPASWAILYLNRISIIQVVFTVFLGLGSASLLITAMIAFKHKIDLSHPSTTPTKNRSTYPALLCLVLLSQVVCLLTLIKIYISITQIGGLSTNGLIPTTCLTKTEVTGLTNKLNPIIVVLVLVGVVAALTVIAFVALPYSYFGGDVEEDGGYRPVQNTERINEKDKGKNGKRPNGFQISRQELLEEPVKPEKRLESIAVGSDEPMFLRPNKKNSVNPVKPEKICVQTGVGNDQIPKKVDASTNSLRIQMKSCNVGNHTEFCDQYTDYQNLEQQQSIKQQAQNARSVIRQAVLNDGYYYLGPHAEVSKEDSESRSTKKLENMSSSGRKLLNTPLKASQGSRHKDWSHSKIVQAGQLLNHIYTPRSMKKNMP